MIRRTALGRRYLLEMILCLLATWGCVKSARAQAASPAWTWEFVASHVPNFDGKGKENKRMLIIEVVFRNNQMQEQRLTVGQEEFHAMTEKGRPIEVLGLLFRMMNTEGAKSMMYTGGIKRVDTLNDTQGDSSISLIDSPGPVEVTVQGGQSYKQRLLLAMPKGKKPIRLKFNDFPELVISLPQ